MLPALLLLLQDSPVPAIASPLASTGLAGIVLWLWRQDRQQHDADRKDAELRHAAASDAAEKRYSAIANDYRQIVTENTAAIQRLTDALSEQRLKNALQLQQTV